MFAQSHQHPCAEQIAGRANIQCSNIAPQLGDVSMGHATLIKSGTNLPKSNGSPGSIKSRPGEIMDSVFTVSEIASPRKAFRESARCDLAIHNDDAVSMIWRDRG
jgi:hypothetical protein